MRPKIKIANVSIDDETQKHSCHVVFDGGQRDGDVIARAQGWGWSWSYEFVFDSDIRNSLPILLATTDLMVEWVQTMRKGPVPTEPTVVAVVPPAEGEKLFSDPTLPGRKDINGDEWYACDPYPHWFRIDDEGQIIDRDHTWSWEEPTWADYLQYKGGRYRGRWWDVPPNYRYLKDEDTEEWSWIAYEDCVEKGICPECGRDGWNGKYARSKSWFGSGCPGCGFCY